MSLEDRYSVVRVNDRLWVVLDKAREGAQLGGSVDENGARVIMSLLGRIRRLPSREVKAPA